MPWVKRREMCRELCSRRAYLEKLLLGRDIDIEKCVKMCSNMVNA
jgi:hypothetical protein